MSMTTGERLALLSGLSGVSAAEHLKKIAGTIGLAGALLVMASGLPSGTAEEHLLAEKTASGTPLGGQAHEDRVRTHWDDIEAHLRKSKEAQRPEKEHLKPPEFAEIPAKNSYEFNSNESLHSLPIPSNFVLKNPYATSITETVATAGAKSLDLEGFEGFTDDEIMAIVLALEA